MEDIDLPIYRSDANEPEEVSPWKEHTIESNPKPEHPRELPTHGTSKTTVASREVEEKMTRAMKERLQDTKEIPPEIQKAIDTA